jgi:hypothetical protein
VPISIRIRADLEVVHSRRGVDPAICCLNLWSDGSEACGLLEDRLGTASEKVIGCQRTAASSAHDA